MEINEPYKTILEDGTIENFIGEAAVLNCELASTSLQALSRDSVSVEFQNLKISKKVNNISINS